jgi:spore coat polysaccharide biosynthesis protein SpsF
MTLPEIPIVLQARMGSSRLPGKVMRPMAGRPLIAHCIHRLAAAGVGPVILATTTRPDDDILAAFGRSLGLRVVRGPVDDVLQRFVLAADYLDARFLIRATGDNPAVDIEAPRRVAEALLAQGADHAVDAGLPCGATVEGVRIAALYQAAAQASDPYDREHVTPFLYRNPARFVAIAVPAAAALQRPELRLTVDTAADFDFVERVLERAGSMAPLGDLVKAADELKAQSE